MDLSRILEAPQRKLLVTLDHLPDALRALIIQLLTARHQLHVSLDRRSTMAPEHSQHVARIEPLWTAASPIVTIARPRVVSGFLHQPSLDRILVDIAHQAQQIPILLHEKRLVPTLEKMSRSLVAPVEPLRIGRLKTRH